MNILITGANGQLGNELKLLSKKYPAHSYFFTDVDELDITNEKAVYLFVMEHNIKMIINSAAYTAVDAAEDNPKACHAVNCDAPRVLASAMQNRNGFMIHISTDYVYDGKLNRPYVEEDRTNPQSVYGATKLAGEDNVIENCKKSIVIRTAWLYSAFGNNFMKNMIKLGKERDALNVVYDQIGAPTYAGDLAQVIFDIIEKGFDTGIYHYSNEGVCSWYDFAVAIHREAGIKNCKVSPILSKDYKTKAKRPAFSVLNKAKIKETYRIEIPHWQDSLAKCVRELKKREK